MRVVEILSFRLKGCSCGAIAIFLSQQIGCMEFSVSVHMVRLR